MEIIKISNVTKTYGEGEAKVEALRGIDFKVEEGDMVAIMGPSGSGKSTLLDIIGFLDKPSSGKYEFNGQDVEKIKDRELANFRNKYIGFVVQNFALIDDYTVYQNVKVPLDYNKAHVNNKKDKVEAVLKKMGILDKKDKLPKQLSGGQNQRVAIARALVNDPKIILADEPTGALDRKTGDEVMKVFTDLNKEGKTIVIITHDKSVAEKCKRIIYIEDGTKKGEEV